MECLKPMWLSKQEMEVPCGKCAFCLATRRSDWALRLHYEAKLHTEKRFVTLTYANNNLIWKNGVSQLEKRHLQLWFKKLRKAGGKIRYYAVGEYGSETFRPHYHIILFGHVSDDVIRSNWNLGHVHIGNVTDASIMYTLGYVINGSTWKMRNGREKPFALMSRKPGLGANYLSPEMVEWHKSGRKNYAQLYDERRHLPRYFKTKIFSKLDQIRIAHRDQKNMFKAAVKWLRSPSVARLRDPLAYRQEQRFRHAKTLYFKTKQNQII